MDRLSTEALDVIIDGYYLDNPTGGSLHIVLDDGGIENTNIQFCLFQAIMEGDWIGAAIAVELLKLWPPEKRRPFLRCRACREGQH